MENDRYVSIADEPTEASLALRKHGTRLRKFHRLIDNYSLSIRNQGCTCIRIRNKTADLIVSAHVSNRIITDTDGWLPLQSAVLSPLSLRFSFLPHPLHANVPPLNIIRAGAEYEIV